MKKRNLIIIPFLFYFVIPIVGQKLIWNDKFSEYSLAQLIIKTSDEKILIAGAIDNDSLFVALYDINGTRLKFKKFYEEYKFLVSLVELENGDFLLFSYGGNIWKIDASLDSVYVIASAMFHIKNSFYNTNEITIIGDETKLVLSTSTLQTILQNQIQTSQNKLAFLYKENKEYYFDVNEITITMSINDNIQKKVYRFKNIDTMNQITKTFQCQNGEILLIGDRYESVNRELRSTIVYRISQTGELIWSKKFIHPNSSSIFHAYKLFKNVTETNKGELLFTGTFGISPISPISEVLFVKLDSKGSILSDKNFKFCSEGNSGNGIVELNNEIFIAATVCTSDFGQPDRALIFKLDNVLSNIDQESNNLIAISPNPSFGSLVIDFQNKKVKLVQLFTSLGKIIKSVEIENEGKLILQLPDLQSGIYYIQCTESNGNSSIKKWVKN